MYIVFFLPLHTLYVCTYWACRSQKRASLELSLQTTKSSRVGAGIQTQVLCKSSVFLIPGPSLGPRVTFLTPSFLSAIGELDSNTLAPELLGDLPYSLGFL